MYVGIAKLGDRDNIERDNQGDSYRSMLAIGISFECGLALIAVGLGWLLGPWPWIDDDNLNLEHSRFLAGLRLVAVGNLGALPLVLLLVYFDRVQNPWMRRLEQDTRRALGSFIVEAPITMLLAISLAAGVGEELLFRGWLQRWVEMNLQGASAASFVAVGIASVIFGLCHAVSWNYAFVATIIGVYLGMLMVYSHSLLCPIATHATYDFLAMLWMRRQWSARNSRG